MNTRKVFKITLAALVAVALVIVGVAIWPPPKEALALHPTLDVTFEIEWIGVVPFNAQVFVELLDENDNSIGEQWNAFLAPDGNFQFWTHQFTNIPDEAVRCRFKWYTGPPSAYDWDPWPDVFGDINWEEEAIFQQVLAFAA